MSGRSRGFDGRQVNLSSTRCSKGAPDRLGLVSVECGRWGRSAEKGVIVRFGKGPRELGRGRLGNNLAEWH